MNQIAADIGDQHTLGSLIDYLSELLTQEQSSTDESLKQREIPSLSELERVDIYRRLLELAKMVQRILQKQSYVDRRQVAGNPCLPCLIACLPSLGQYIRDRDRDHLIRQDRSETGSQTGQLRHLMHNLQDLLLSGDDEEISQFWQLHAPSLSHIVSDVQRERITTAQMRTQLLAEFRSAYKEKDARLVHTLYKQVLTHTAVPQAELIQANSLDEAGYMMSQIEKAIAEDDINQIENLFHSIRKCESPQFISKELHEKLIQRYHAALSR